MKKIFLGVLVAMLMVSVPLCTKAEEQEEEKETITFTYDYSEYNGGDPDDYLYSWDKVNWTSERTTQLVVGEMCKLYVKIPDGRIGLVMKFIATPEMDDNYYIKETTSAEVEESSESVNPDNAENNTENETIDSQSEAEETETSADNESNNAGAALIVAVFLVLIVAMIVFGFLQKRIRSNK